MDRLDIAALARQKLTSSNRFNSTPIRVNVTGNRLVLSGTVGCWFHKQIAQETVKCIPGVDIENRIEVLETNGHKSCSGSEL